MKKKLKNQKPVLFILAAAGFAAVVLFCFFAAPPGDGEADFMADGVLRVCLDAGHGGEDPGATDSTGQRLEKDDCLRLVLAVQDKLSADYPDVEIVLTRDGDTYPDLEKRCDIANDSKSDLSVSIHRNSAEGQASGVEIWVESSKRAMSDKLAKSLLSGLKDVGISNDRGVKYGTAADPKKDYYVNANRNMPGCLIEMGFITSESDNELLDKNLDGYASAISSAIGELLTDR